MAARIVVFGATGYTGRLVSERLVAQGVQPVLAGRSEERLRDLAQRLGGLGWEVADVHRESSMFDLVRARRRARVHGRARSRAGASQRCAPRWPSAPRTWTPRASRRSSAACSPSSTRRRAHSGAVLLTAMGYDFVPGALAAGLALREAGERAARVDVGYYALGGGPSSMSRGTRASLAGIALAPSYAFRGGAVRTVRSAERMRTFHVKGKERPAISVGGAEHFTVPPPFGHLREVNVYLGWFGPLARGITATSRATAFAGRVPGLRDALVAGAGKLAAMGDAPAEGTTPGGLSWIAAAAYDAAGEQLAEVHLSGADGYDFTAGMLAWAARRVAVARHGGHRRRRPAPGLRPRRARARLSPRRASRACASTERRRAGARRPSASRPAARS